MIRFLVMTAAVLTLTAQPGVAATSVATRTFGMASYDASTATLTAVHNLGNATLSNFALPLSVTTQPAVATLKINFAAPLVRTDEVNHTQWSNSGHRQIASIVRGTAISFEYAVDSLPDADGVTINLLSIKSQPGFNIPFYSLSQLTYYYDAKGKTRPGFVYIHNPYTNQQFDVGFIGLFAPCNCSGSAFKYASSTSAFTVTSEINNYVQNIFEQSNAFRLFTNDGYNLWNVTTPGVSVIGSYTGQSRAEWSPAVPEPTSWAMMIAGFGLVGTSLRRQRRLSPAR